MTSAASPSARAAWPPDTSLLDAVGSAVIATDLDGRIFYWNPAAERLYGYSPSSMLGANVGELLILPDDQSLAAEIMATVVAGGSWSGEFNVRCADAATRRVRITNSPLLRDGEVVGVIGVAEDHTERWRARGDADLRPARSRCLSAYDPMSVRRTASPSRPAMP